MNKNTNLEEQSVGIPVSSSADCSLTVRMTGTRVSSSGNKCRQSMNKIRKQAYTFTNGTKTHGKISESVKRKLNYGAKILQAGGINRVFKRLFSVVEEERLLNAFQCYLSTTAGPIAGLMFISTEKISFCSEKSIKMASPDGEIVRVHYKVSIPLSKIKRAEQKEDLKKASQKYIEIVTVDDFDFWFLGFLNSQKAFGCLQQVISNGFR